MITKRMSEGEGWAWAGLVAHAINSLSDEPGVRCCPHMCAPCGSLQFFHDEGMIDELILPYVRDGGGTDWDWWDETTSTMRWEWITNRWCDPKTCKDMEP